MFANKKEIVRELFLICSRTILVESLNNFSKNEVRMQKDIHFKGMF